MKRNTLIPYAYTINVCVRSPVILKQLYYKLTTTPSTSDERRRRPKPPPTSVERAQGVEIEPKLAKNAPKHIYGEPLINTALPAKKPEVSVPLKERQGAQTT